MSFLWFYISGSIQCLAERALLHDTFCFGQVSGSYIEPMTDFLKRLASRCVYGTMDTHTYTHSHLVAGLFTVFAMQPARNEFLFISVISYQGYTATALSTNSPKGLVKGNNLSLFGSCDYVHPI